MPGSSFDSLPPTQIHGDPPGSGDVGITERQCQLVVVTGPEAGRTVAVKKTPFVVGKDDDCDLMLSDPTVSRQHFTIEQQQGAFVIRDLGSTNGTWIDQLRIREAWLRPGTVVRAGQQQVRFESVFRPLEVVPAVDDRFGALVGRSVRMRQIFTLLERIARTEATVVIFGETGTGKSAVAQAIHDASPRRAGPFVTVDCGAIADNLVESELFGHEKGAFTGADRTRIGALERAQGGTLFIDELVDLRLDLQPRLLRVLEEREVRRVGANAALKLDVRIIAASRFDLWREVQQKRFREDLYFRLAVFTLPLPSLRERREDIPLLATAIARAHARAQNQPTTTAAVERLLGRFSPAAFERLMAHPFPGNVRELRNVLERAIALDADPTEMLGPTLASPSLSSSSSLIPSSSSSSSPGPAPPLVFPVASSSLATSSVPAATTQEGGHPAPDRDPVRARVTLHADCTLPFKEAKEQLLEEFEAAYFRRLLAGTEGNASALARRAGIDRKHLYTLARKHNLDWKGRGES